MISVSLETYVIWEKVSGKLEVTVYNSGPEDLWCQPEYDGEADMNVIQISGLELTFPIGENGAALSNDIKAMSATLFELKVIGEVGRFVPWSCSEPVCIEEGRGLIFIGTKKGTACLPAGQKMKITINFSEGSLCEGDTTLSYEFKEIGTEKRLSKIGSSIYIMKEKLPEIQTFGPEDLNYGYGKNTQIKWNIKDLDSQENFRLWVDGKEQSSIEAGSLEVLLKDNPIELILEGKHDLELRKKFYPIWFFLKKMETPEKNVPKENETITIWWKVVEADTCMISINNGEKTEKKASGEGSYAVRENDFLAKLYYLNEKKEEQEETITYQKPQIVNGINHFLELEEVLKREALTAAPYGGIDPPPKPPTPPVPPKVKKTIRWTCSSGDAYCKINNKDGIFVLPEAAQQTGIEIEVTESNEYKVELWDCYGCKVTGEI